MAKDYRARRRRARSASDLTLFVPRSSHSLRRVSRCAYRRSQLVPRHGLPTSRTLAQRCQTNRVLRNRGGILLVAILGIAGCSQGGDAGPTPSPTTSETPSTQLPAEAQLAGFAAHAQDQQYSASYRFTPTDGTPAGMVTVAKIKDGFRLDMERPATTKAIAHTLVAAKNASGTFRCQITKAAKACVSTADDASPTPDPLRLRHVFSDWLETLADPSSAISVATSTPPAGMTGTCFSVEGVAASLDPPVDTGVYCFDDAGRITGLKLGSGTLSSADFQAAPKEIALPAPIANQLPSTAVPSPTPTPSGTSPSASGKPSPTGSKSTPTPAR